jgi:transcriptional regulator
MYVPPHSRESRVPVLQEAVERIRFGTLVTYSGGSLHATHLPMTIDPAAGPNGVLIGHIARNNPQWQHADERVAGIASFLGPHFYVTPTWYATKAATGKVVPTWNYIAVEARGNVRFFDDRERLLEIVERLTDLQEAQREPQWAVADAPTSYIDAMLGAIIGLEMPIEALEGAWKLGQHRSAADRNGVAQGIAATTDDAGVRELLPLLRPSPDQPAT